MLNIQNKRQSWALYFAGFLLFVQLVSLILPVTQVHAALPTTNGGGTATDDSPYGKDSTTERAEKWVLARAVSECLDANGLERNGRTDATKILTGDITAGEFVGRLVEGQSSDDGQVDCDPIWQKTHERLGWSTVETVCDSFKMTREFGECERGQGSGWYELPDGKDEDDAYFGDQWNALFRKEYLGDRDITASLTSAMKYWIYYGDFKQKCGDDSGGGFKASPWEGGQKIDDRSYHIQYWYTGGKIQNSYVITDDSRKGNDVHTSGYKMLDNKGDNNDIIKCRDLADNLDAFGPAFVQALAADEQGGKAQSGAGGALATGDPSDDRDNSCEADNGGLAWFGCAILEVMDGIIGFLDSQVRSLLTVHTEALDEEGGLKKAWGVLRNFAYLILVPMMLLMVIGTAIGFGPFDAYTVKKALPRMVSAVIFMSISYYICLFLINVSNDVGKGIFNLITLAAPGGQVNSLTDIFGSGAGGLFTGLSAGGVVIAGFTGAVTWGVLGSFALVTVVALLIGYVILVIRQVLLIMLLVLSPLAILVWIFPGNDKLWTIWKTTFIAMLMMFPLIMLLIASGRFFAATVDTTFGGATGTFIKLIAYIAPYFFIPATFKYGLGVFGNIAGMINDRGRGVFDRQRKFREGNREKYRQRAREGKRFAGGNSTNWRGKLNRGISGGLNAPGAILDSGNLFTPGTRGQNWRSATRTAMTSANAAAIERTMKEDRNYQTWAGNDTLNKAAAESNTAKELRDNLVNNYGYHEGSKQLEDAVTDVEKVRRTMNPEAFRQMTTLQAISGGTAYKGSGEVAAAIGRAAGNDDNARAWMVAQGRSAAMKAGRIDHGGMGFGDLYNESGQMAQLINRGEEIDESIIQASTDRLSARVYEGQGGGSLVHASMKPEAVKQVAPAAVAATASALASGDSRTGVQSLASLAATQDGLSGSSPEKARIWADGVMNQPIDINSLGPEMRTMLEPAINSPFVEPDGRINPDKQRSTITYREAVESLRGNSAFNEMRREYSSSIAAQASRTIPPRGEPGAIYDPNNPNM